MGCLDDEEIQHAFERSNLPEAMWPHFAAQLDAVEQQERFRVGNIREFSLAALYLKPDGSSMGSESHLLGILPGIGLVIVRQVGGMIRRHRVESQFMVFSDAPGISFHPDDRQHGRGWGEFAVQGVLPGGQPALRLSWPWSDRAREVQRKPANAGRERDRILRSLPH